MCKADIQKINLTRQELLTKLTAQAAISWKKLNPRPLARKAPGIAMTAAPAVAFSKLKIVERTPPGRVYAAKIAKMLNYRQTSV